MADVTTKSALKSYIKSRLGYPVVNVVLEDTQLENIITDTILKFKTFAIGISQIKAFVSIVTEDGVVDYTVPSNVSSVQEVVGTYSENTGINTLFTFENALYRAGYLDFRNFDLISWQLGSSYLETLRTHVQPKVDVIFNPIEHKIRIIPTPRMAFTLLLEVYLESATAEADFYNHVWVRDFSVALAMEQVGINMNKYGSVVLPGGATINAQFYLDEGKARKEKLLLDLRTDFELPIDWFVG